MIIKTLTKIATSMPSIFKTPTLQKLKPYYFLFVLLLLVSQGCKEKTAEVSSQTDLPEK